MSDALALLNTIIANKQNTFNENVKFKKDVLIEGTLNLKSGIPQEEKTKLETFMDERVFPSGTNSLDITDMNVQNAKTPFAALSAYINGEDYYVSRGDRALQQQPVNENTQLAYWSVSKMIVGLCFGAMWTRGYFNTPHTKISKFFPEIKDIEFLIARAPVESDEPSTILSFANPQEDNALNSFVLEPINGEDVTLAHALSEALGFCIGDNFGEVILGRSSYRSGYQKSAYDALTPDQKLGFAARNYLESIEGSPSHAWDTSSGLSDVTYAVGGLRRGHAKDYLRARLSEFSGKKYCMLHQHGVYNYNCSQFFPTAMCEAAYEAKEGVFKPFDQIITEVLIAPCDSKLWWRLPVEDADKVYNIAGQYTVTKTEEGTIKYIPDTLDAGHVTSATFGLFTLGLIGPNADTSPLFTGENAHLAYNGPLVTYSHWGANGTMGDLMQILKMAANGGVSTNGTRVIDRTKLNEIITPAHDPELLKLSPQIDDSKWGLGRGTHAVLGGGVFPPAGVKGWAPAYSPGTLFWTQGGLFDKDADGNIDSNELHDLSLINWPRTNYSMAIWGGLRSIICGYSPENGMCFVYHAGSSAEATNRDIREAFENFVVNSTNV